MFKLLPNVIVGLALLVPIAAPAQDRDDHHEGQQQTKRYYDRSGKDYHQWNDNEARYYQQYTTEKHLQNRDFSKLKSRQRDDYFKWRHEHHDDGDRH